MAKNPEKSKGGLRDAAARVVGKVVVAATPKSTGFGPSSEANEASLAEFAVMDPYDLDANPPPSQP